MDPLLQRYFRSLLNLHTNITVYVVANVTVEKQVDNDPKLLSLISAEPTWQHNYIITKHSVPDIQQTWSSQQI